MNDIKRGALYIRVSTNDQVEYSPASQIKLCKKYAKEHFIEIIPEHVYQEDGISGTKADKRPQFQKMIANAKSKPKPFDVILIYDFSRFARNKEESVMYKALLRKKLDIEVISITQPLTEGKESIILESMYEAMDEYYSVNLSENVKRGKIEKASRGEFQGQAPYGYIYDKNTKNLIINEETADVVKMIFKKWIEPEMTIKKLCNYMNNTGIKTTKGHLWCDRTMKLILQNPAYIGKVRFTEGGMLRNYSHPNMIIKDGKHKPIIDMETWNLAKQKMDDHHKKWYKYKKEYSAHKHWLNGLLKCDNCGASLTHVGGVKNKYPHFQCCGYTKGRCKVSHYLSDSQIIPTIIEQLKKDYTEKLDIKIINKENTNEYEDIQLLEKQLKRLESKLKRIKDAYINEIDTLEEYKENKKTIEKEKEQINKELEKLNYQQTKEKRKEKTYKLCEEAYKILSDENASEELKDDISHRIFEKIVYNKKEESIEITYK